MKGRAIKADRIQTSLDHTFNGNLIVQTDRHYPRYIDIDLTQFEVMSQEKIKDSLRIHLKRKRR